MASINRPFGRSTWTFIGTVLVYLVAPGCVLAPPGTAAEQRKIDEHTEYRLPVEQRQCPPLPERANWQDVLHAAFLTNGDLEASYREWQAAMARIKQAAAWPNSDVALSYSYMFSSENMKAFDRNSFGAGFDPAMNLQLPIKPAQAGKVALEQAREAGFKFLARKFALQKQVLTAYYDLALAEERVRIQHQNTELLRLLSQSAQVRVQAGAPLQDLLKIQIEFRMAENELGNMEAEIRGMRAMLNAMLGRAADAPLILPAELPAARPVPSDDQLLTMGVAQNPELAALAAQVAGRQDALELARLRYIPDINPSAAFTGSLSQALGAMVMLPTNIPARQGAIEEAAAMLQSSQAMSRQTTRDRAGSFVAALYFMRNFERQGQLFQKDVTPLAEQVINSSRQAYTAGTVGYTDLIDSQRTFLNVRLLTAQVRMEREKRLAELEALAGTDIETLPGTPQPTSPGFAGDPGAPGPASQPASAPSRASVTSEDKTP